ncbi:MAG: tetratricopeptide repeat protein [Kiritimatiellia bacterium]
MNDSDNTTVSPRLFRLAPWVLAAAAFGVYWITLCRGAFPGLPAKSVVWHLGLDASPTLLDSLWGYLVRGLATLPVAPAFGAGLLSAVCGAASVGLVAALMMRVRYAIHDLHDPDETRREAQARLLAGTAAGLFTAASLPFWILSTRSLPGTFHLLMLLGAAWLFSEYQRTGQVGRLYLLGLLYGAGATEFATFWVFAPLAALLVVRAMLQRAEFSARVLVRTGLCLVPGLLLYVVNGVRLARDPAVQLRGFKSAATVIWYVWRDQWHLIANAPQTSGFLLIMALTVVPWGVMYLLRGKKPAWRFSAWQTFLRLVVLTAALATLFDAPVSPWHFFGMSYVMVTPYLILAACAGAVAGEFWVMGQRRDHRNAGIGQPLRTLMGGLGVLIPIAAVAAGLWNLPAADGRPGTALDRLAGEIVDDLQGRDVLLSNGVLDDNVRLQAARRGQRLVVVTWAQTGSTVYRQHLARYFDHPRQQSLLQVGFSAFLQDFLTAEEGLARTAALDLADPLRESGYLAPDRLVFRAEPAEDRIDVPALLAAQHPFWQRMEAYAAAPLDPRNPAFGYQRYVLRMASKVANDVGFMLVERNDAAKAREVFRQARRIFPDNVSALLNLLTIAMNDNLPEAAEYQAAWEEFRSRQMDSRVMWSLAGLYGYVHNTGWLVRQGMMWAVSGKPRVAEAELRRAVGGRAVNAEVKAFLGRAYLHGGDLQRSAEFYRAALQENPRDVKSLRMLADISMAAEEYAEAERLFDAAVAAGLPAETLGFERVALAYLRGQTEAALAQLKDLVKKDKENVRAWGLLAMLTADGSDPEAYDKTLKALKGLMGTSPDVRLLLADLHVGRNEWSAARAELDQVIRMNPRLVRAWELLVQVDFQERKRELAEDHVRILLTLDPENFTGNLMLGSFQYSRGQLSLAESSYRTALAARRDPVVLNDLAYLLMLGKSGAQGEARALIEEALARQPGNVLFLSTRGELNLREGRYDEAEQDLQRVLLEMPDHAQVLLLSAQLYAARGQTGAARDLAATLADRQSELPAELQSQLQALIKELR